MKIQTYVSVDRILGLVFNILLILPASFFLVAGFRWLVNPEAAASSLMMPLLTGAGLSSQMGDLGALFLGMGLLTMGALVTRKGDWLFAVALFLSCIVIYRLLAFALYYATLIMPMVAFELILAVWYFTASRILSKKESMHA